jgi:hypothetical protein
VVKDHGGFTYSARSDPLSSPYPAQPVVKTEAPDPPPPATEPPDAPPTSEAPDAPPASEITEGKEGESMITEGEEGDAMVTEGKGDEPTPEAKAGEPSRDSSVTAASEAEAGAGKKPGKKGTG